MSRDSAARQQWRLSANRASRKPLLSERPILLWSRSHLRAFVRIMTLMYLASDELTPAAESALAVLGLASSRTPLAATISSPRRRTARCRWPAARPTRKRERSLPTGLGDRCGSCRTRSTWCRGRYSRGSSSQRWGDLRRAPDPGRRSSRRHSRTKRRSTRVWRFGGPRKTSRAPCLGRYRPAPLSRWPCLSDHRCRGFQVPANTAFVLRYTLSSSHQLLPLTCPLGRSIVS